MGEEVGDNSGQGHPCIVLRHHQSHDAGIEGELEQNARRSGGGIGDGIHIPAQITVEQNTQEQEDHIDDVQIQVEPLLHKVIHDVRKAQHKSDKPQDLIVLNFLRRGIHGISLLRLVHQ